MPDTDALSQPLRSLMATSCWEKANGDGKSQLNDWKFVQKVL